MFGITEAPTLRYMMLEKAGEDGTRILVILIVKYCPQAIQPRPKMKPK